MTTDTPLSTPVSSKALLAASGNGLDNGFPDQFVTPSAFTVAFKSFKFIQQEDNPVQGQTPVSYTILNRTFESPQVVELKTGETAEIAKLSSDPQEGTYDRVEYEVSYFEMTIPLCKTDNTCQDRRLRFYLTNMIDSNLGAFSATAMDLLFSLSPNSLNFGWVRTSEGFQNQNLIPITDPRPIDPVQIPPSQFGTATPGPLFSKALIPPLEVPKKPKVKFIFTLNFGLKDLFFFDNTDETTIDPTPPFHFNVLENADTNVSRDGRARSICSTPSTGCPVEADFWPGLPVVTPTVTEEPM